MNSPKKPFELFFLAPVVAVMEHSRTVRGFIDRATGQTYTDQVKLGWFVHIDVNGVPLSFGVGHEKPNLEGKKLLITIQESDRDDRQ